MTQDQIQRIPEAQRVGVVLDIHRGCAQVDDAAADGALLGVSPHLGHQVVVDLRLDFQRSREINVVLMGAQIGGLLGGHQSCRLLRLGQCDPDPPPKPAFVRLAPQPAHLRRAVAPGEG